MVEPRYDLRECSNMRDASFCSVATVGLRPPSVADCGLLNDPTEPDY